MERQDSINKKQRNQQKLSNSSKKSKVQLSRNLFALIGQSSWDMMPYRSKFQLNSIDSGKSRQSRDSDLLNRLAKVSSTSSKSLTKNISFNYLPNQNQKNHHHKSQMNSSNSNSIVSQSQKSVEQKDTNNNYKVIQTANMAPKIHNCVCFVAGQCLNYNCNCFLSPYPCAPDCCPNCLMLKSNLPLKMNNICSCKKTKCLKLYCQCLSKGQFCSPLCRCQFCQNSEHSIARIQSIHNYQMYKGCSCQKSHCQKKYCDCFAQGLKCTSKCICIDCNNYIQIKMQIQNQKVKNKNDFQKMDEEQMQPEMEFQQIDFFGGNKKK